MPSAQCFRMDLPTATEPVSDTLRTMGEAISALLSACVTINVYFPAAAAEKAADKIIDEVLQSRQANKPAPAVK